MVRVKWAEHDEQRFVQLWKWSTAVYFSSFMVATGFHDAQALLVGWSLSDTVRYAALLGRLQEPS